MMNHSIFSFKCNAPSRVCRASPSQKPFYQERSILLELHSCQLPARRVWREPARRDLLAQKVTFVNTYFLNLSWCQRPNTNFSLKCYRPWFRFSPVAFQLLIRKEGKEGERIKWHKRKKEKEFVFLKTLFVRNGFRRTHDGDGWDQWTPVARAVPQHAGEVR